MHRLVARLAQFLALLTATGLAAVHAQSWQPVEGAVREVAVNAAGAAWAIGTKPGTNGFEILRRSGNAWVTVPGAAEHIAVDPQGNAWAVTTTQVLYRFDGAQWLRMNALARDVAVGADGTVWILGNLPQATGYDIYRAADVGACAAGADARPAGPGRIADPRVQKAAQSCATWTRVAGAATGIAVDPAGRAWVVDRNGRIARYDGAKFVAVKGTARDIAIGADGVAWAIAADGGIYRWQGTEWVRQQGTAAQLAAGPAGVLWAVTAKNAVLRAGDTPAAVAAATPAPPQPPVAPAGTAIAPPPAGTPAAPAPTAPTAQAAGAPQQPIVLSSAAVMIPSQQPAAPQAGSVTVAQSPILVNPAPVLVVPPPAPLQSIPAPTPGVPAWARTAGSATDVGVGANGAVWIIGRNRVPGGFDIYRRRGEDWERIEGGAVRIAVDPRGNAWVVNDSQTLFRHDGTRWITVNRQARDVGVGADGTVWVIGNDAEAGGYGIYRSGDQGASWRKVPGSALRVSVEPSGNAWVVNSGNAIFRFDGEQWRQQPGAARDVGVGADGATWAIGTDGGIYRFEAGNWARKPGGASDIAAGPNGIVWVVNAGGEIYQAAVTGPAGGQAVAGQATSTPPALALPTGPIVLQGGPVVLAGGGLPVVNPSGPVGTGLSTGASSGQLSGGGQIAVNAQGQAINLATGAPLQVQSGLAASTFIDPYAIGPVGPSAATCGVPGKGLCGGEPATFVRNATIDCPSGSFPDLGLSSCWSCPDGYSRSAAAVDTPKACQKPDPSVQGGFLPATYQGPLCPEGSFHDPIRGGECYSCPSGYTRSAAHIDAANACYIPISEDLQAATRVKNTPWPWECPGGSFHDAYDGGGCWTCPSDYRRTLYAVWDSRACAQTRGETWSRATLVKKAQCGPGEIQDLRIQGQQNVSRGGGCWTCPIATDRTIFAIDTRQACERAPGIDFESATRVQAMTCESNEIFDPINSNNANVSAALAARNLQYPSSPISPADRGGTCWTCPPGTARTVSPVYGGEACRSNGIRWKPAPYNQPGLFGLRGAESVAQRLVRERTVIDSLIQDTIANAASGSLPANYAQTVWQEIATRPQDSAVLKMAVFSRVVAAANEPSGATPAEIELRDDAVAQIQRFRIYMAQDALDAYRAWKNGKDYRDTFYAQSQLQAMANIGEVPPDFEEITAETILGSLAASGASDVAIGLTLTSTAVFKRLFPYAMRATWRPAASSARAAGLTARLARSGATVARVSGEAAKAGAAAAAQAAGSATMMAVSIGPQIIVTFAIEVLAAAIEQQIDIANAEPKLRAGLATAQNDPVNFARLMSTAQGTTQAQAYWSNLMGGPAARPDGTVPPARPPLNLQAFATAAAR